jgi:hypothetical protein
MNKECTWSKTWVSCVVLYIMNMFKGISRSRQTDLDLTIYQSVKKKTSCCTRFFYNRTGGKAWRNTWDKHICGFHWSPVAKSVSFIHKVVTSIQEISNGHTKTNSGLRPLEAVFLIRLRLSLESIHFRSAIETLVVIDMQEG